MDGTCNGLQHLSALGRDPLGAKATNLAPNSKPEDIYQQVALVVKKQISSDNAAKIPEAALWSNVDRKLVKRATMTTPYGVTLRGIRDQLIRENFAGGYLGESADLWKSADYLAHVLQSSIATVVVKGIEIMEWLRTITRQLAKSNRPLKWTLPTGFVAVHEYRTQRERRIVTAQRTLVIYEDDPFLRIKIRKQLNAIAPNLIHSLDAAHLMLTVLKLAECGLSNFAMVHDSYGVHACDIDLMNRILREEFVEIYEGSLLERFFQEQCEANPDLATYLPRPPSLGSFKIAEVVKSDYFFA
jgi:DNA-directed RNA polymerase